MLLNGDEDMFVEDEQGFMLKDDDAARNCALAALPDMARDHSAGDDHRTCFAIVRNEFGEVIYRASLTLRGEWVKDAVR